MKMDCLYLVSVNEETKFFCLEKLIETKNTVSLKNFHKILICNCIVKMCLSLSYYIIITYYYYTLLIIMMKNKHEIWIY